MNHTLHGDTNFPPAIALYLSILGSHVILSVVALPMVLLLFSRGAGSRRPPNRTLYVPYLAVRFGRASSVFLKVYAARLAY